MAPHAVLNEIIEGDGQSAIVIPAVVSELDLDTRKRSMR